MPSRGDAYRESEREDGIFLNDSPIDIGVYKGFKAFRAEIKQLLAIFLLLFLGKAILRLGYLELAAALKGDQADSKICTTYEHVDEPFRTLDMNRLTKV